MHRKGCRWHLHVYPFRATNLRGASIVAWVLPLPLSLALLYWYPGEEPSWTVLAGTRLSIPAPPLTYELASRPGKHSCVSDSADLVPQEWSGSGVIKQVTTQPLHPICQKYAPRGSTHTPTQALPTHTTSQLSSTPSVPCSSVLLPPPPPLPAAPGREQLQHALCSAATWQLRSATSPSSCSPD